MRTGWVGGVLAISILAAVAGGRPATAGSSEGLVVVDDRAAVLPVVERARIASVLRRHAADSGRRLVVVVKGRLPEAADPASAALETAISAELTTGTGGQGLLIEAVAAPPGLELVFTEALAAVVSPDAVRAAVAEAFAGNVARNGLAKALLTATETAVAVLVGSLSEPAVAGPKVLVPPADAAAGQPTPAAGSPPPADTPPPSDTPTTSASPEPNAPVTTPAEPAVAPPPAATPGSDPAAGATAPETTPASAIEPAVTDGEADGLWWSIAAAAWLAVLLAIVVAAIRPLPAALRGERRGFLEGLSDVAAERPPAAQLGQIIEAGAPSAEGGVAPAINLNQPHIRFLDPRDAGRVVEAVTVAADRMPGRVRVVLLQAAGAGAGCGWLCLGVLGLLTGTLTAVVIPSAGGGAVLAVAGVTALLLLPAVLVSRLRGLWLPASLVRSAIEAQATQLVQAAIAESAAVLPPGAPVPPHLVVVFAVAERAFAAHADPGSLGPAGPALFDSALVKAGVALADRRRGDAVADAVLLAAEVMIQRRSALKA